MKMSSDFFIGLLVILFMPMAIIAQEVEVEVSADDIYNREFSSIEKVMETENNKWRNRYPTIWSSENEFKYKNSSATLPTSILLWQLDNIGGEKPPFHKHDDPPGYQWFTTSPQTWYKFHNANASKYSEGNVEFNFKIPSSAFAGNKFHAGDYTLSVSHNYENYFTPNNFEVILDIEEDISYLEHVPLINFDVSSLDEYRSTSTHVLGNLGDALIGNTVNFNLWIKGKKKAIKFKPSGNGKKAEIDISTIILGGTSPKITSIPLSNKAQNYSPSPFDVVIGNKHSFKLELAVQANDFLEHFYSPGTYTFKIEQKLKGSDTKEKDKKKETDINITVPPLSEIVIPANGSEVNFVFNTDQHYKDGQTENMENQLRISNNEPYDLYVRSDAPFFNKAGIQSDINSDILDIGIDGGNMIALSTTSQKIIENGPPVLDRNLDIKYTISPTGAQILATKDKGTYSINVIYSFIAP